jgi:hypothetical protein
VPEQLPKIEGLSFVNYMRQHAWLVLWVLVFGDCVVLPSNASVCPDALDR